MKKEIFLSSVFLFVFAFAGFSDPFNKRLSDAERERLYNGEVLIRNLDSRKELCVNRTPETAKVLDGADSLKPNYVAEIIQIRPYKGNEDLESKLNSALINISDYVGIPYFSERTQSYWPLYEAAEITSAVADGHNMKIFADLTMEPFGKFRTQIDIQKDENCFFYSLKNLDKLRYYDKFNAVGKENMQSYISLFRDGDNWILYAVGGVNTFKIFFIEDRVETSFMNRIKTFCNFIFDKI